MTSSGEPGTRPDAAPGELRGPRRPDHAGRTAGAAAGAIRGHQGPRQEQAAGSPAAPAGPGEEDQGGLEAPASAGEDDSGGQAAAAGPAEDDQAALASLRWDWGEGYEVSCADGRWTARCLPGADVLAAGTASALRDLISEDYARRRAAARAGQQPGGTGAAGAGEQALRRLIEDGIV